MPWEPFMLIILGLNVVQAQKYNEFNLTTTQCQTSSSTSPIPLQYDDEMGLTINQPTDGKPDLKALNCYLSIQYNGTQPPNSDEIFVRIQSQHVKNVNTTTKGMVFSCQDRAKFDSFTVLNASIDDEVVSRCNNMDFNFEATFPNGFDANDWMFTLQLTPFKNCEQPATLEHQPTDKQMEQFASVNYPYSYCKNNTIRNKYTMTSTSNYTETAMPGSLQYAFVDNRSTATVYDSDGSTQLSRCDSTFHQSSDCKWRSSSSKILYLQFDMPQLTIQGNPPSLRTKIGISFGIQSVEKRPKSTYDCQCNANTNIPIDTYSGASTYVQSYRYNDSDYRPCYDMTCNGSKIIGVKGMVLEYFWTDKSDSNTLSNFLSSEQNAGIKLQSLDTHGHTVTDIDCCYSKDCSQNSPDSSVQSMCFPGSSTINSARGTNNYSLTYQVTYDWQTRHNYSFPVNKWSIKLVILNLPTIVQQFTESNNAMIPFYDTNYETATYEYDIFVGDWPNTAYPGVCYEQQKYCPFYNNDDNLVTAKLYNGYFGYLIYNFNVYDCQWSKVCKYSTNKDEITLKIVRLNSNILQSAHFRLAVEEYLYTYGWLWWLLTPILFIICCAIIMVPVMISNKRKRAVARNARGRATYAPNRQCATIYTVNGNVDRPAMTEQSYAPVLPPPPAYTTVVSPDQQAQSAPIGFNNNAYIQQSEEPKDEEIIPQPPTTTSNSFVDYNSAWDTNVQTNTANSDNNKHLIDID